jgi:hypothetical protein
MEKFTNPELLEFLCTGVGLPGSADEEDVAPGGDGEEGVNP